MKAVLALHFEAEVDGSVPCAQCHGRTLLAALYPGGPIVQLDALAVERTGDREVPARIDVSPHDCRRWRGEARARSVAVLRSLAALALAAGLPRARALARETVLSALDDAERREAAGAGPGPGEGGGA